VALIAACYVFWRTRRNVELARSPSSARSRRSRAGRAGRLHHHHVLADIRYVLQRAKLLSELDDLTALYGARLRSPPTAVRAGAALTRPASVADVDLDNLKSDQRLARPTPEPAAAAHGDALRAELRYTDLPAARRDEFIVLLPETPPRGALDVAERIRKAVADRRSTWTPAKITSSVSIGRGLLSDEAARSTPSPRAPTARLRGQAERPQLRGQIRTE